MAKRKPALTRIEKLLRSDGALCVTFVNTARRQPLGSYDDLLAWALESRALTADSARRLSAAAAEHPGQADRTFRRARTLLGRLERILGALAAGDAPAASDFKPFNAELRQAMAYRELDPSGRRWSWGDGDGSDLDRMLWPVLYSTALVLTSSRRRVRRCGHEDCGLLFVARGAGMSRRWCSATCRTRRSSKTHYEKRLKPRRQQWRREAEGRQRARLAGYDESWEPSETESGGKDSR